MPGAIARPSKQKGPDPREDAFLRFVNRVVAWTGENLRIVVGGVVAVGLLAVAAVWYVNYQSNLEQQAAGRLQSLRAQMAAGSETAGLQELQSFLDRFGGTESAGQARVMLGRRLLSADRPQEALEAVRPAAQKPADTPEGYAARSLLAKAQEAAGDVQAALGTLETLAENARFGFQRRQAAAERARILTEQGRLAEAEAIYQRLVEEASDADAQQLYAVRLGEVRAMQRRAAGSGASGGEAASEGSDEEQAGP